MVFIKEDLSRTPVFNNMVLQIKFLLLRMYYSSCRNAIMYNYKLCLCTHVPLHNRRSRCEGIKLLKCTLLFICRRSSWPVTCPLLLLHFSAQLDRAEVALYKSLSLSLFDGRLCLPIIKTRRNLPLLTKGKNPWRAFIWTQCSKVFSCRDRKWGRVVLAKAMFLAKYWCH